MPDNLIQHVWTYLIMMVLVPVILDKVLIFPSRGERMVFLVLMGILWPLTLIMSGILFVGALIWLLIKGTCRRVRSASAKVRALLP